MSDRLRKLIHEYELRAGKNGKAQLAIDSGLSIWTLKNIERGHIPKPETVKQIALACGLTNEEAVALAREASEARTA